MAISTPLISDRLHNLAVAAQIITIHVCRIPVNCTHRLCHPYSHISTTCDYCNIGPSTMQFVSILLD